MVGSDYEQIILFVLPYKKIFCMVAGLCHFVFSSFHPEITFNIFSPLIVLNGFDTIHLEPIITLGEKPIIMRYRFWLFLDQYKSMYAFKNGDPWQFHMSKMNIFSFSISGAGPNV